MATITSLSDLLTQLSTTTTGIPSSEQHIFMIDGTTGASVAVAAPIANVWTSLWTYNKSNGANGATPGSVAAPTSATVGALPLRTAQGGKEKFLIGMAAGITTPGVMIIYDRVMQGASLTMNSTSPQNVLTPSLTRNVSGAGNRIWLEVYVASSATNQVNVTASYTNTASASGRTTQTVTIPTAQLNSLQKMWALPLQGTDTGVLSVETVTFSATQTTPGTFGITIGNPVAIATLADNTIGGVTRDFINGFGSFPKVESGACLAMAHLAGSTASPIGFVELNFVEK